MKATRSQSKIIINQMVSISLACSTSNVQKVLLKMKIRSCIVQIEAPLIQIDLERVQMRILGYMIYMINVKVLNCENTMNQTNNDSPYIKHNLINRFYWLAMMQRFYFSQYFAFFFSVFLPLFDLFSSLSFYFISHYLRLFVGQQHHQFRWTVVILRKGQNLNNTLNMHSIYKQLWGNFIENSRN